ncbi:MAG: serine/threonine protein kinase, partial [Myxococcales bacterium]|nr:serine/threonine protein kinase [Myxococcales bacterium]
MSGLGERPFGKYVLLERIAAGGMAEVYRALLRGDSGFEKTVALKLVLPDLDTDEQFLRLFRDEARIASTLTHANVIQTFDHGEIEQRLYLALEFVDGLDLGRLIDRLAATQAVMPPAMAAFVVAEAARGLAYAHDKQDARGAPLGIVHRDVSPRNILMSRSGEVKVADFGVARAAGKLFRTATGVVLGKVRYMAPEQMDGRPIDARADIYSLGAILYELITGTRLFRGHGDAAVIVAVSTGKLDAPSTRRPDIPPALASLAMRALALDPERRPARAIDLARELTIFLQTEAPHFTREDLADLVVRMAAPPAVAPPVYDALPVKAGAALLPPDTAPTVAPPVHDTTPVTAATTLHVSDT